MLSELKNLLVDTVVFPLKTEEISKVQKLIDMMKKFYDFLKM